MSERTRPSDATRSAEKAEAAVKSGADRAPDEAQSAAADRADPPDVSAEFTEAMERGANAKGEGSIP